MFAVFAVISVMFLGCPKPQPGTTTTTITSYRETDNGGFAFDSQLTSQSGWEAEVPRGYVSMHFTGSNRGETHLIYTIIDHDLTQTTEEITIGSNGYVNLSNNKVAVEAALLLTGMGIIGAGHALVSGTAILATAIIIGNSHLLVHHTSTDWQINVPFGPNVLNCQVIQETSAGDFEYFLYPEEGYDADGDSLPDSWERKYFGNLSESWGTNFDMDCLLNGEEMAWGLHPTSDDFDHDGYTDCEEIFGMGSDPFDINDPGNEGSYVLSMTTQGSGTATGAGTYAAGTQVTITATPATGWTFHHWMVNGTTANNNPGNVSMDSDVAVVAVFTQVAPANYVLTMTTQGSGTTTGAGTYPAGTQVTITATPASGWTFDHWTVNGVGSTINPGVVTMNSDVSVIAVFTNEADPGGLIHIDLAWNGNSLSLAATNANPGVIGLELYHQTGGSPWVERQTFAVTSGNANGTVNKFRPNILRFGVVSSATSGGYIPPETMVVKINGQLVPLVTADGLTAFQVDVSTL